MVWSFDREHWPKSTNPLQYDSSAADMLVYHVICKNTILLSSESLTENVFVKNVKRH